MIRYQCTKCRNTFDNEKPIRCICGNKKAWEKSWVADQPSEEQLKQLQDPKLLENILSEIDQYVPFEKEPKKAVLLAIVGRHVLNKRPISFNLFLNGVSGAGKDFLVGCMLKMCVPEQQRKHFQEPSPKALKYEGKEADDWANTVLYIEDPSQAFLDSDYTKVFISSVEGTATSVDENRKRIEHEKKGKPSIIMTSAETDLNIEALRRWFIIPIIAEEKKTKRILSLQAEKDIVLFKTLNYLKCLNSLNVHIPFGKKLAESLPTDDVIILSVHERMRDFIKASAILHQKQRDRNERDELIATKQDYEEVKTLFEYCLVNSIRPTTKNVKELLNAIASAPKATTYIENEKVETDFKILKDILPNIRISKATAYKQLGRMVSSGFLQEGEVKDELNRTIKAWKVVSHAGLGLPSWGDDWENESLDSIDNLENLESLDNLDKTENLENEHSTAIPAISAENRPLDVEKVAELRSYLAKSGPLQKSVLVDAFGLDVVQSAKKDGFVRETDSGHILLLDQKMPGRDSFRGGSAPVEVEENFL